MSTAIAKVPSGELDTMGLAQAFVKSGYFQDSRDVAQAIVKIQAGKELGVPPLAAMKSIHVVKGKITLEATLIGGLIKKSGKYGYRIVEHTDAACEIEFTENGKPCGPNSRFSMADAQKAGLTGNDTYRKYPRNMLFARAMTNGARWYCAEVFQGPVYTPDELGANVDPITGEVQQTEVTVVPQRQRLLDAVKETEQPQLPAPASEVANLDDIVDESATTIDADEAFTIAVTEAMDARSLPKKALRQMKSNYGVDTLLLLDETNRKQLLIDISEGIYDTDKEKK